MIRRPTSSRGFVQEQGLAVHSRAVRPILVLTGLVLLTMGLFGALRIVHPGVANAGLGELSEYTTISAGSNHSCAIADGQAYCWGSGGDGRLGNNSETDSLVPVAVDTSGVLSGKTITAISAGERHTCAVADGRAYCWGYSGQSR